MHANVTYIFLSEMKHLNIIFVFLFIKKYVKRGILVISDYDWDLDMFNYYLEL